MQCSYVFVLRFSQLKCENTWLCIHITMIYKYVTAHAPSLSSIICSLKVQLPRCYRTVRIVWS